MRCAMSPASYAKGHRLFIDFDYAALERRDGDMLLG